MDARNILSETFDVSRETMERLEVYADALIHWQRSINLVASETIDDLWTRHILDSAQLIRLAPEAKQWADLGSGAGLPGMVIGLLLSDIPDAMVYLVESNRKKTAFLRDVKHRTGAAVEILPERIESPVAQSRIAHVDIVTARALASLTLLFTHCEPVLAAGGRALFMKGRTVETEIEEARQAWQFDMVRHQSISQPDSTIIDVRELRSLEYRERHRDDKTETLNDVARPADQR